MLLETNRLIIECFKSSDISDWAKIESDVNVRRFVDGKVLSFKEAKKYVEMNIRQYQRIGYGRYAVRLKKTGNLILRLGALLSRSVHTLWARTWHTMLTTVPPTDRHLLIL